MIYTRLLVKLFADIGKFRTSLVISSGPLVGGYTDIISASITWDSARIVQADENPPLLKQFQQLSQLSGLTNSKFRANEGSCMCLNC